MVYLSEGESPSLLFGPPAPFDTFFQPSLPTKTQNAISSRIKGTPHSNIITPQYGANELLCPVLGRLYLRILTSKLWIVSV